MNRNSGKGVYLGSILSMPRTTSLVQIIIYVSGHLFTISHVKHPFIYFLIVDLTVMAGKLRAPEEFVPPHRLMLDELIPRLSTSQQTTVSGWARIAGQ